MSVPALRPHPTLPADQLVVSELTDQELFAALLGPASASDRTRATEVCEAVGGVPGLLDAEHSRLSYEGLRPGECAVLLAALELGRRLAKREVPDVRPLDRMDAVVAFLALRFGRPGQEVMGALYLDRCQRLLDIREIFLGTLSRAAAEPRQVLLHALSLPAQAIVLFHTHPSGDPSPSLEDLSFTRRMMGAAEMLGLELLDHLVIGGVGRWTSLRERLG